MAKLDITGPQSAVPDPGVSSALEIKKRRKKRVDDTLMRRIKKRQKLAITIETQPEEE